MFATINGVKLAYSERGRENQTALVLVHGFPANRSLWEAQLAELASAAHVVAPDLCGQGDSEVIPGPYTMDQHADDLAALLDHLEIRRAIMGGLSMGGYIQFAFWRRHPERVQALVLLDTRAEPDSPEGRLNRDASAARIREVGVETFVREMMPRLLAPESLEDPRLAGRALAMMATQSADGLIGALQGMRDRPDSQPTLPTITVPVLAIVGESDRATPPADVRQMAAALPDARVVTIPHAGHFTPIENPDAVNAALRAFVSEVSGSRK